MFEHIDFTKTIVCAANKHPVYDVIVCGVRHHDKLMHSVMSNFDAELNDHQWIQGFVNSYGDFLTRSEAWAVAYDNEQIVKLVGSQDWNKRDPRIGTLYSENLY